MILPNVAVAETANPTLYLTASSFAFSCNCSIISRALLTVCLQSLMSAAVLTRYASKRRKVFELQRLRWQFSHLEGIKH